MTTYEVLTWDADIGEFTPQRGVRRLARGKWGLRRALRQLRGLGYDASKGDSSVLVERLPRAGSDAHGTLFADPAAGCLSDGTPLVSIAEVRRDRARAEGRGVA